MAQFNRGMAHVVANAYHLPAQELQQLAAVVLFALALALLSSYRVHTAWQHCRKCLPAGCYNACCNLFQPWVCWHFHCAGGKEDEVAKVSYSKYAKVRPSTFGAPLSGSKAIAVIRASGE